MTDVEVHIDLDGEALRVGTLRRRAGRGQETVTFEYHDAWLEHDARFSLEPALLLTRGAFAPANGAPLFGSIGDSAPDTWGRRLMQRAERKAAEREKRPVRTLQDVDYLLGVSDVSRLGALRFRPDGGDVFLSERGQGVPGALELGRLLQITERIGRDEETEEDLQMIFAPGSSLGGARPKASVFDQHGRLSIAKFPKETDDYSLETWEAVALDLAVQAGIRTAEHDLVVAAGKPVLLSHRFDRHGVRRIPFLSALSLLGLRDGEQASYPELMDGLVGVGADVSADAAELYRRLVFNVLVSNVDDHLRNHGFLWSGKAGWRLSPVYDVNPTPTDVRARTLTTGIQPDAFDCDLGLVLEAADYFNLSATEARGTVRAVAEVTATWREAASRRGAKPAEIKRMQSAFEHADLDKALAL
ncbi:type II toxin-antitoxin system HipA family toxin [Brevundimonas diminuta ATCC 11568]